MLLYVLWGDFLSESHPFFIDNFMEKVDKKICKICKEEKVFSDFHREARYTDGYLNKCKVCRKNNLNIEERVDKKQYLRNYYYDVTKPKRKANKKKIKAEQKAKKERVEFLAEPLDLKGRSYDELTPEEKFKVTLLLLERNNKK